jgi:hypothetical protein
LVGPHSWTQKQIAHYISGVFFAGEPTKLIVIPRNFLIFSSLLLRRFQFSWTKADKLDLARIKSPKIADPFEPNKYYLGRSYLNYIYQLTKTYPEKSPKDLLMRPSLATILAPLEALTVALYRTENEDDYMG